MPRGIASTVFEMFTYAVGFVGSIAAAQIISELIHEGVPLQQWPSRVKAKINKLAGGNVTKGSKIKQ